jgi:hypothetical protein
MTDLYPSETSVTRDGDNFVDRYGDRWIYFTDDCSGHYAVNHEDGEKAGEITVFPDGSMDVFQRRDGDTFGVNCDKEFIVADGQWTVND